MAIHLLFFNNSTPPNALLDGAIVVVDELVYGVVVTVPARQAAVVENTTPYVRANEAPLVPLAIVTDVDPHLVVVTEVLKPIALILEPEIPKAVVIENTSAAETE